MQRGEIFVLRAAPPAVRGSEQRGKRYGVVVQAAELLVLSTVIVAPTSTRARAASFRPEIAVGGEHTRVLVEQLGAVDPERLGESKGLLSFEELRSLDESLALIVGLAD